MLTSLEEGNICRPYERMQSHHCAELNIVTVSKDAKNASWKADRKRHSKTQELAPYTQKLADIAKLKP